MSAHTTWDDEYQNLGREPDTKIAARLGVSRERVRQVRQKRGIEAQGAQRSKTVATRAPMRQQLMGGEVANVVGNVTLTEKQVAMLIDRRHELGFTQSDVAQATGYTTVTLRKLDTGEPVTLKTIADVCAALGVECKMTLAFTLKAE